jgi:acyl-[acyl-carrier-protein]-phospholipid O-acyltransferase / long-chain-fatty-acid--[acyl-carrier-protein] ligase
MSDSTPFRRSCLPWWLELIAAPLARLLYRVKYSGVENIPSTGGALVLANHISYIDTVILQLACPVRRLRFVGYSGLIGHGWFYRWIFKVSGTIPISGSSALEATRRVVQALKAGEVVCLFPEGQISRTGQLMRIQRGFELMARQAGVPVIPAAHDGLWGSVFSFSGNRYLFKSPRLMRTHAFVAWGQPIPPAEADATRVRREMLDLGCAAFHERPQLKRHLGREIVRGLARRPWRVEMVDRTAERRELKAGQILAAAAALARHLQRTVPGKRVGIVLPPGAGSTIANLAVQCAGKVPVNLNFTAGADAVRHALRVAEIETVLSADAMKEKVKDFPWPADTRDFRTEMSKLGGKKAILPWLLAAWLLPNQWMANLLRLPQRGDRAEAGLLFTSGSSGEPKGVVLTHRNILANCWQISSLSILPDTATLLACLPIFHSFGFTVTLWYPMLRGCRVVSVPSPLDTRKMIDAIREDEVTVVVGAPTFLRPLVKKAETADFRSLDLVVSGAEKLPDDLFQAFKQRFHIEIMQGYGLTETTPVSNVNQPHPPLTTATAEPQPGKFYGSVGRLLPGVTARILNPETYEEMPPTEAGIVALRGANVFEGYLLDEAKTAAAFHRDWFVTGDLGRFDEDGFLFIEGRLSRFSKIGGEMIPHGTIEQKIVEAYDLDQAEGYAVCVMGVADVAKGEALVLLTTRDFDAHELRDRLVAVGLPNLWVPRLIHKVPAIPVLGSGKLDLKGCKELAIELCER